MTTGMVRAAIIAPDSDIRHQTEQLIAPMRQLYLVRRWERYPTAIEISRFLQATATQLVFLSVEHMARAATVIENIVACAPDVQFVAVDRGCDLENLRRLARLGVRDFVTLPATTESVAESLAGLFAMLDNQEAPESASRVFTFLPCKAGVGASTTAVQVSHVMSRLPNINVLLADFDLNNGVVGVLLGLKERHTILDAAERAAEMDEVIWPKLVSSIGNLDVLNASDIDSSVRIDVPVFRRLLEYARRIYKAVCIDLSGNMEKYSIEAMHDSHQIVLVCGADIPSIHLAQRKLRLLRQLDLQERVRVVLNQACNPAEMPVEELEKLLGAKVSLSLPNDRFGFESATGAARFVPSGRLLGQRYRELATALLDLTPESQEPRKGFLSYLKAVPGRN
jgi:pilus assembly protein CpaE